MDLPMMGRSSLAACATPPFVRTDAGSVARMHARSGPGRLRGRLPRHPPALLRAAPAGFSTSLAVLHLVFLALRAAGLAYIGAEPTHRTGQLAAAGHVGGGEAASRSAIHVQRDA